MKSSVCQACRLARLAGLEWSIGFQQALVAAANGVADISTSTNVPGHVACFDLRLNFGQTAIVVFRHDLNCRSLRSTVCGMLRPAISCMRRPKLTTVIDLAWLAAITDTGGESCDRSWWQVRIFVSFICYSLMSPCSWTAFGARVLSRRRARVRPSRKLRGSFRSDLNRIQARGNPRSSTTRSWISPTDKGSCRT